MQKRALTQIQKLCLQEKFYSHQRWVYVIKLIITLKMSLGKLRFQIRFRIGFNFIEVHKSEYVTKYRKFNKKI